MSGSRIYKREDFEKAIEDHISRVDKITKTKYCRICGKNNLRLTITTSLSGGSYYCTNCKKSRIYNEIETINEMRDKKIDTLLETK